MQIRNLITIGCIFFIMVFLSTCGKREYNEEIDKLNKGAFELKFSHPDSVSQTSNDDFIASKDTSERENEIKTLQRISKVTSVGLLIVLGLLWWIARINKINKSNRNDLELLSKIGIKITSNLDIEAQDKKEEIFKNLYAEITQLQCIKALPDFSVILYSWDKTKGRLERMCLENENEVINKSSYGLDENEILAVCCFNELKDEYSENKVEQVINSYCLEDWPVDYTKHYKRRGLYPPQSAPYISGNKTLSKKFIPLLDDSNSNVLGILSFQTTKRNAFKSSLLGLNKGFYIKILSLTAEFVVVALKNSNKHQQLEQENKTKEIAYEIDKTHINTSLQPKQYTSEMMKLAKTFRTYFKSEYCGIGKVFLKNGKYTYYDVAYDFEYKQLTETDEKERENFLNGINEKYPDDFLDAFFTDSVTATYEEEEINNKRKTNKKIDEIEKLILRSKKIRNIIVLKALNKNSNTKGYIQLINSNKNITDTEWKSFAEKLGELILLSEQLGKIQIQNDTDKINNFRIQKDYKVRDILQELMKYLSKEFEAPIISFRIPIIDFRDIKYYLREIYISDEIIRKKELEDYYWSKREIIESNRIREHQGLRCYLEGEGDSYIGVSRIPYYKDFDLKELIKTNNYIVLPIFKKVNNDFCLVDKCTLCRNEPKEGCKKYKNIFGVFCFRLKKDLKEEDNIKERLGNLSIQISALFNFIQDRNDTDRSEKLKRDLATIDLNEISKNIDEKIVNLLRSTTNSKVCSIHRFWKLKHPDIHHESLYLSATTAKQVYNLKTQKIEPKSEDLEHKNDEKNIFSIVYNNRIPLCLYRIADFINNSDKFADYIEIPNYQSLTNNAIFDELKKESMLLFPIMNRSEECLGVISFIGKEGKASFISNTFWYHDIVFMNFFISIIERYYDISSADKAKSDFWDQLMHELKSPLANIVDENLQIIRFFNRDNDFPKERLADQVRNNLNSLSLFKSIIENVGEASIKESKYDIHLVKNPRAIILDIVRLFEDKKAMEKQLNIQTNISEMPPIKMDAEKMKQVFINLLDNAIKYSERASKINIYYRKIEDNSKKWHEISFANYGIGIIESDRNKIFDYAFRSDNAIAKIPSGMGIGLKVVKSIVVAHGGTCFVSRLTNPTVIAIHLPD